MEMIQFYKSALALGDLCADDQGMISHFLKGEGGKDRLSAITIQQRRLVLPTPEQLKNPEWANRICFHPLVENQVGSESIVHERFRRSINMAINLRAAYTITAIANICRESRMNDRNALGAEFAPVWAATKKADDKFYANVIKILDTDPMLVHTVVQRGLKVNDSQTRVGVDVYFPLLEEINESKDRVVAGVPLRNGDIDTLKNLYELIFPGSSVPGTYSRGSDSTFSPTLFAQLRATAALYDSVNPLFTNLGKLTEAPEFVRDVSWIEDAVVNSREMNEAAQAIGLLDGNGGKPKKKSTQGGTMISPVGAPVQASQPTTNVQPAGAPYQPVQNVAPAGAPVSNVQPAGAPIRIGQQTQVVQNAAPAGSPYRAPQAQPVVHSAPVQQQAITPVKIGMSSNQTNNDTMNAPKIGMDPSNTNNSTSRSSSSTGWVQPQRQQDVQQQPQVVMMNTPAGVMPVQAMTMAEATALAQQQVQQQQVQQQQMQMNQIKAQQAQMLGYQVFSNGHGSFSIAVSDGKGGVVYQAIEEWTPPAQAAGTPIQAAPLQPMQPMMANNVLAANQMVPMPQQQAQPAGNGPISITDWIRSNPVAMQQYNNQLMQQQQAMMMQQYGMVPGMQQFPQANQAYVPTHMRVAQMLPAGMVRPVGS